jgi:hypothetical protein
MNTMTTPGFTPRPRSTTPADTTGLVTARSIHSDTRRARFALPRSMPGTSGVHGTVTLGGRHVVTMVLCCAGCVLRGGPVWAGQARCADAVRGCPCGRAARSPRARTYSGQRRHSGHHPVAFPQVREYVEVQAGAGCKTVGSAYVGSNPTPATTCGNGPLAAETRPAGRFLLVTPCIAVSHRESMRCGVHGHIADGVRAARTVGAHRRLFHGRPRTGRAGGPFLAWRAPLSRACILFIRPAVSEDGAAGRRSADSGAGGPGERDSCRAERARVARAFTAE